MPVSRAPVAAALAIIVALLVSRLPATATPAPAPDDGVRVAPAPAPSATPVSDAASGTPPGVVPPDSGAPADTEPVLPAPSVAPEAPETAPPPPPDEAEPDAVPPHVVRYESGRLTVRVVDVALDRLLAEIAAATHANVRGTVGSRPVSIDFRRLPLFDGLARIFGAESFMLTYARDGTLRSIDMLGKGAAKAPSPTRTPQPPLAEEEAQATVLQRTVPVSGPLADALGGADAPIGRVLHAAVMERDPAARTAAREAALAAFTRDPEVEAAYLSTLTPVDDAVLARILEGAAADPESVGEWMSALATRAPSAALRAKAAAVLTALQRDADR